MDDPLVVRVLHAGADLLEPQNIANRLSFSVEKYCFSRQIGRAERMPLDRAPPDPAAQGLASAA